MKTHCMETCGLALALTLLVGCGAANAAEKKGMSTKTAETSVTTNDNGSVSRTFVESSVTTNGNLVTERRRETRTNMDAAGNILETSTSEYAQSYNVGDTGWKLPASKLDPSDAEKDIQTDTFMGLKFGDVIADTNTVREAGEPSLPPARRLQAQEGPARIRRLLRLPHAKDPQGRQDLRVREGRRRARRFLAPPLPDRGP